jgi:hypothetical protein
LWIDGVAIEGLSIDKKIGSNAAEIPAFSELSGGWANYQSANPEFVVWIDEVAVDADRVGCAR